MIPKDTDFLQVVNAEKSMLIAIRGHQAVERALNAAISEALAEPHALEVKRLSFALKIDLGVAVGVVRSESRPTLKVLNRIRNDFAHRPEAALDARTAADLSNALSEWQRHALVGLAFVSKDPVEVLRNVLAVLFVEVSSCVTRLRDQKLTDQALHEMVQERLANSPVRSSGSDYGQRIDEEIRARLEAKRGARREDCSND